MRSLEDKRKSIPPTAGPMKAAESPRSLGFTGPAFRKVVERDHRRSLPSLLRTDLRPFHLVTTCPTFRHGASLIAE